MEALIALLVSLLISGRYLALRRGNNIHYDKKRNDQELEKLSNHYRNRGDYAKAEEIDRRRQEQWNKSSKKATNWAFLSLVFSIFGFRMRD